MVDTPVNSVHPPVLCQGASSKIGLARWRRDCNPGLPYRRVPENGHHAIKHLVVVTDSIQRWCLSVAGCIPLCNEHSVAEVVPTIADNSRPIQSCKSVHGCVRFSGHAFAGKQAPVLYYAENVDDTSALTYTHRHTHTHQAHI